MVKYKKKEMLQMVNTLVKANEAINKVFQVNREGVMDVLIQGQEAAMILGTSIEGFGKKYNYLVKILEDYCENLYQISVGLSNKKLCKSLYKEIKKQLEQLYNGIEKDIPDDRREIVFLPYKASMWDSLESVWKEADKDENTDVYVIPIPYFDKNSDGTFRKEYYEGNLYPEYVPITKYDEYDFEQRRPDIIYIHNPYDECNVVTSVHPFFYSKNLKKFTEQLVYIPYFILEEINPNDKESVNNMKHFCITPGVINADKVIVQSENMREIYINVLTEVSGNTKEMREYWAGKIDGSGSPKVDKILNTKKEDLEIPEEWLRIIQKPEGSWKKIIFYNTSIGTLLDTNEQMLRKMEKVFEIFKRNKEEVALLWRPHPLIESTLISMRPQLWEKYKIIRDKYVNENWGIYDDSADMDRAIVLSDMYYGDRSSILTLCKKCNKKIMIQDFLHINDDKDLDNFLIWDLLEVEDKIYFLHPQISALFIMDNKDYIINKIYKNRIEDYRAGAYGMLLCKNNKIYIFPQFANSIEIFDISTNTMSIIDIPINKRNYLTNYFQKVIEDKENIYMISEKYSGIIKVDIYKNEITIYNLEIYENKEGYILDSLVINSNIVILDKNRILFINKKNGIIEGVIELGDVKLLKIIQKDEEVLCISIDGNLYNLNTEFKRLFLKSTLDEEVQLEEIDIFNGEKGIWLVDKVNGIIFELDNQGKIKDRISIYGKESKDIYAVEKCITKQMKNKIYISSLQKYKVFVFEMDTKRVAELNISMNEESWRYLWNECDNFDTENEFPKFRLEERILWK